MNILRLAMLTAALAAPFLLAGYLAGGAASAMALAIATGTILCAWWSGGGMLLSLQGARAATEAAAPDLLRLTRQLAAQADLPIPAVYIAPDDRPNAFVTGRSPRHAALCVTSGLLSRATAEELAGVLAHEFGHIRHRDMLTTTIPASLSCAVSALSKLGYAGFLLAASLSPVAALLVWIAASRESEFEADREGARISGHPLWLIAALQRLASGSSAAGMFSSHPATEARIARLRAMADHGDAYLGLHA